MMYEKSTAALSAIVFTTLVSGFIIGCAGTNETRPAKVSPAMNATHTRPAFDRVTFQHEIGPVGDAIRLFGEEVGGGLVLMSGLEERAMASDISFRQQAYQDAVGTFAASIDCTYVYTPWYYLIVPPGYEVLQGVSLRDVLDPRYRDVPVEVTLGAKNELYNTFSALGVSVGVTLVADNFISEARVGEMFLPEVPFHVALEAILQSARIAPGTFVVESTPEYIFIHAAQNTGPADRLLNADRLTQSQRDFLNSVVSVTLPQEGVVSHAAFTAIPIPLHDALLPLTEQLGIEVVAQRRLADIPITPCVMQDVTVATALNLLLRQWPLPDFGYEMQENRILIRHR